jgi:GAF domain-containing protein
VTDGGLHQALQLVAGLVVTDLSPDSTLQRIAELTQASEPHAVAVGVTLIDATGQPTTAAYTDPLSPAVDEGQYEDGTGPCVDACAEDRVIVVPDVSTTRARWPSFTRLALEHGVRSTLSLPLSAGKDRSFGAMNLYATEAGAYTDELVGDARMLATGAAAVLANARAYWEVFDLAAGLQTAMRSRAVIEQAKGKIMATSGCSAEEAFQVLVAASQRENVKLRDIAKRMVDPGVLPSPE